MFLIRIVFVLFIGVVLPSLISLGLGVIFAKTIRLNRLGVKLIAMSVLVPGRFISSRCRQFCDGAKCGNWNCDHYSHCRK